MKKIAMILSGCGNKDGSEITEAVSAIVALSEFKAQVRFFAPDLDFVPQNYLTNQPYPNKRNIMEESSRITRSEISPLGSLAVKDFDGLVIPGGFGVALHLSEWANKGPAGSVLPDLESIVHGFYQMGKPICAICIAPAIIAKLLGRHRVTVTLGLDRKYNEVGLATGAIIEPCASDDYISDRQNKIITTPAYMNEATPYQVFTGIRKAIKELIEMA
ncbi:MAG: isoprenoid biosynthesis glyoxalase ElbB [Pseudobdellovibrionaceae bacterium]|nr:isoprenoid biosynthesis glyoxalase ElbB [Pseudobdellovibrionaceae bacterium]